MEIVPGRDDWILVPVNVSVGLLRSISPADGEREVRRRSWLVGSSFVGEVSGGIETDERSSFTSWRLTFGFEKFLSPSL